jgi:hypothetical protein
MPDPTSTAVPTLPLPQITTPNNPTAPAAITSSLPIPATMIKQLLSGQPAYTVNRERAAAVLDAGFKTADTYNRIKPALFVGGLIGMAASVYAMSKRHGRGGEAIATWATVFLASAATAWVTRPIANAAKPPAGSSAAAQNSFGMLAIIDKRRAELKAQDPNFADKVFARFDALPVVAAQLDASPLLKAVL